jgi:hypothetical protein
MAALALVACSAPRYGAVKTAICPDVSTLPPGPAQADGCDYDAITQTLPAGAPNKGIYLVAGKFAPPGTPPDQRPVTGTRIDVETRQLVRIVYAYYQSSGERPSYRIFAKREATLTDDEFAALVTAMNDLWSPASGNAKCAASSSDLAGELYLFDGRTIARYDAFPQDCAATKLVDALNKAIAPAVARAQ